MAKSPDEHTHPTEDEMFFVLDGNLTFHCGVETFEARKGSFIFLPHGIQHGYAIPPGEKAHLLVITAPVRAGSGGGWGGFISDFEQGQDDLISEPEI